MSSFLAIHLDATTLLIISFAIIWVFSVISILFGLKMIRKIFTKNS